MSRNRTVVIIAAVVGLLLSPGSTLAQEVISAPATKTVGPSKVQVVPSLAVLNSGGASLQGGRLTLTGVAPNAISSPRLDDREVE